MNTFTLSLRPPVRLRAAPAEANQRPSCCRYDAGRILIEPSEAARSHFCQCVVTLSHKPTGLTLGVAPGICSDNQRACFSVQLLPGLRQSETTSAGGLKRATRSRAAVYEALQSDEEQGQHLAAAGIL
ncbi:hypothetical protein EYF80_010942 [Liparis tanakae]|uniref:Uncharacterized protein n=1 Tax=Liparis tanakae TaxID=230148 RepID=A0A4Z2INH2_9TELE|nr:hypothetical protein EYF80_010942 [Liparis tanakae]